jgi:hypothetical protein
MAPVNPVTGEEPVGERGDHTSAKNNRNKSRPVHLLFLDLP